MLSKGGDNFFIAHIKDKERYIGLVDKYASFMRRTANKVRQRGRQLGLKESAARFEQNNQLFK